MVEGALKIMQSSNWSRWSATVRGKTAVTLTALFLVGAILLLASGGQKAPPVHLARWSSLTSTEQALSAADVAFAGHLAAYKAALMRQHLGGFHKPFVKEDWDKFTPVVSCPEDRPLTKYGEGDGSKLLCKMDELSRPDGAPCIIYSLGSHGDYQFEASMLKHTACDIYTFDCTFAGKSIDAARHHYYKWCIGSGGSSEWRTWSNITQTLGHTIVDVLKMDIEGHEYPVLAGFEPSDTLPREISLEFHVRVGIQSPDTPAELALVFLHLANLGYASYSQEVNVAVPSCCCEFTFMRR